MSRLASVLGCSAAAALFLVLVPCRARAYLMDANDARVITPGTLEFELQPIGYYRVLVYEGEAVDTENYLIVPSIMGYVGLTEDADLIFLTRGYYYLDHVQDSPQPLFRTYEAQMGFRLLLLRGAYSTDCIDGPSLVLQPQILVPNLSAPGEVPGFSLALLLGQQWEEWGTLHANIWWNRNADQTWGTFAAVAMEGPPGWDVRPLVEVTYWYDEAFGSLLSGIAGTYIDIGDDFTWELGARVGGWERYAELEVRISMWMDAPLHRSLSDAEDDPCHGAGAEAGGGSDGGEASEPAARRAPPGRARAAGTMGFGPVGMRAGG